MVWRFGGDFTKFGVNLLGGQVQRNWDLRTDGRTDANVTTVALLCSSTK